ncbi:ABC transporter permease [Faecalicatena contorta]|uniref:Xylose transport system permease protein XylH n=1 Tax=Faecalicatena contorta TaxID=39482 RepID=A0A316A541_9FIRM|nr:ABC transporter permease [Faecalicatena contorta]PWJ51924.1 ribose transport system permease protein [Faecalicatena contorta]SUQ12202.1 ribose transport system permease protein [Faecalicatena contorta]
MEKLKKGNVDNLKLKFIDNVVWVLLLIGIVVFIILKPTYFNPFTNMGLYLNIPMQASVMGVMTIGLAGTILLGDIDLSCVGIMSVSAAVGILLFKTSHVPVPVAIIVILLMGGLLGFVNGVLIAKLKAVALIETLAMNTTLAGVVLAITRGRTITINERAYTAVGQGKLFSTIPYLVIIFILIYVLMYFVWNRTPLGRSLFVVGGNAKCARVSGINVDKIRIMAFTISGLMAGLAGLMLSSKMGSINSVFGSSYSMDIIAAAVIGGTSLAGGIGKVSGVLGGVLLLNFVQVGLQVFGMDSYYVQAVTGLIILLAVLIDSFRIRLANKE